VLCRNVSREATRQYEKCGLGDHSGYSGDELALWRITCGFCNERGNFEPVHHLERKNSTTGKKLNYDTFKCSSCGNLTMVYWSASVMGGSHGMHDYRTVPWAREVTSFPDHWPKDVGRYWLQARRSLDGKNWDAAVLMARSAVQLVARLQNAAGKNLKEEIDDLTKKGLLPPVMREWSHEVRALGNDSAHPTPGDEGPTAKDARDIVDFLGMLLTMVYNLPHDIAEYRARKPA
jgi:Domain of unknown function (DUF4145)